MTCACAGADKTIGAAVTTAATSSCAEHAGADAELIHAKSWRSPSWFVPALCKSNEGTVPAWFRRAVQMPFPLFEISKKSPHSGSMDRGTETGRWGRGRVKQQSCAGSG